MIDVSDGLLIDLSRLCNESRVGARLYEEKIPISAEMRKAASCLGLSPLTLALSGGEDYELLFTAPPGKKVKALLHRRYYRIEEDYCGQCREGEAFFC